MKNIALQRLGLGIFTLVVVLVVLWPMGSRVAEAAKEKSLRTLQANRLKNIGLAVRVFSSDQNRLPDSLSMLLGKQINGPDALIDPVSGKPFIYVSGGDPSFPQTVIAYPPLVEGKGGVCLMADGSVQSFTPERFQAALRQTYSPANVMTPNGQ